MINNEFDKIIAEVLKEARERKSLSTRELASRAGVGKSSISAYENLSRSMTFEAFKSICGVLDLDYIQVFEDAQKQFIENERQHNAG